MAYKPGRRTDPRDIFICAASFEFSGLLLATEDAQRQLALRKRMRTETVNDARLPTLFPATVNLAFALELYFKTLIQIESGKPPKTHKLLSLYNSISKSRRARIKLYFDQGAAKHPEWIRVKTDFPSQLVNLQIPKVFESANNIFTEWRYYFEGTPTAHNNYFKPAVPATRKTILEIKPEWAVMIEPILRA
jgi:hypothetical protein